MRCSVNGPVCLVCCVFDSVCELFGETIRNVLVWLLFCCLILSKCLVWVEVHCWIDRVWSSKLCACCACDPSVHLSKCSFHRFCLCFCMSDVISSFKSLRAGSQVFVSLCCFFV